LGEIFVQFKKNIAYKALDGTPVSINHDFWNNPRTGLPDIGVFESFPPSPTKQILIDWLTSSPGSDIYPDGKVNSFDLNMLH
jgi:hypothetical protein